MTPIKNFNRISQLLPKSSASFRRNTLYNNQLQAQGLVFFGGMMDNFSQDDEQFDDELDDFGDDDLEDELFDDDDDDDDFDEDLFDDDDDDELFGDKEVVDYDEEESYD